MNKIHILLFWSAFLLLNHYAYAQNVGIGTTIPHTSAQLEISSTSGGLLPPRITGQQRNAIVNPAAGLIVFCNDCGVRGEMQYYDGVTWRSMNIGAALDPNTGIGITTHSCGATNVHNAAVTYEALTDADGNIYRTVQIGTQTWMAENLRTTKYRNGTTISNGTDNVTWQNSFSGAYCSYNNNTANDCPYGKLYNWHAVNNTNQLCPTGWHVPTDSDWTNLITFLGGESLSGGKMKSTGIQFWESPNLSATNSTGWSGLPGGFRNTIGTFNSSLNIGFFGRWWSSTPFGSSSVSYRALEYSTQNLPTFFTEKTVGCSVRCVKD